MIVHIDYRLLFGRADAFAPEHLAEMYGVDILGSQRVNRAARLWSIRSQCRQSSPFP